jgi:hypothetical protein
LILETKTQSKGRRIPSPNLTANRATEHKEKREEKQTANSETRSAMKSAKTKQEEEIEKGAETLRENEYQRHRGDRERRREGEKSR